MEKIYRGLRLASVFLLMLAAFTAMGQSRQITGTVTNATDGQAIPGVNVFIKGTTSGAATDVNGKYAVQASTGDVLVISSLGFTTEEITLGAQSILDVVLYEDISTLQEVVVVGYGEMRKANLTSAQASVSSKEIGRTVNTTIEQAIQGRAAGVYVTQNSGQPGGGISVNIRGVNSITGNTEPLYVIDGVQIQGQAASFGSQSSSNPLAGLNPSDIESIEVLQGPSATSIYGSRGTNGVVLITTKRGKSGETKISYGYQYSIQTTPKSLDVMNLREYAQMVNEYHAIAGGSAPVEFLDPSLLGEGTDWQKELYENAPMNKHQLSLSGGSDKTTYFLSGEYLNQDGVVLGSGFDRYSVRLNIDNKAREWFSIGANFNLNQTDENLASSQENVIRNALRLTPQIPVKNLDGSWGGGDPTNAAIVNNDIRNPVAIASLTTNDLIRRQFLGGLNMTIEPIKGLKFTTSLNTSLGFNNSTYFIPKYTFGSQINPSTSLVNSSNTSTYWNWNQLVQYDKQFGKHNVGLMLSHEAQESTWKNIGAGRNDFVVDIPDLGIGDAETSTTAGGQGEWAMESYMARLNYNYSDRYLVTATLRADGSVNFGADNKWGYFPSVSAAWRISEEPFFQVPFISDLKLRIESGTTGNQGGGGGIYSPLRPGATYWGTGFLPQQYSNPTLKWEETKTNNIGINIGLFENRLQFEVDVYVKNTENLLLPNPLPDYMGTNGTGAVGSPTVNIGSLQNKGWSVSVNATPVDAAGFRWNANFNISSFQTEITSFYSDAAFFDRTSWWLEDWTQRAMVGEAPWLFRGYIEEGIFQSQEEIENSALPVDNNGVELPIGPGTNEVWVGDVKFKDISGPAGVPDGIIDGFDQTSIGNPWPKFFAGFTNTFSYKGLELSILITGTQGNDIYNYIAKTNTNPNAVNVGTNLLDNAKNYAKLTTDGEGNVVLVNPDTDVARISNGPNGNYERHTNKWVEDGSFIRIKNISLTYNLPNAIVSKQNFVRGARVSLGAQNIYTLTRYTGYDPEVGAYVGRDASPTNQAIGVDNGRYPLTPVYSFSLGLDF